MHNLLLLRHAKSSHKDNSLIDFDRPLNKRGRRDCKVMGRWLAEHGPLPDLVISSPATRAKQTARRVYKHAGLDGDVIQWNDSVYDADGRTLLKLLQDVSNEVATIMLVGHHQGLESIILNLSRWADIPAEAKLIPTGAIAWLTVDAGWSEIKKGDTRLNTIVRPRHLASQQSTVA